MSRRFPLLALCAATLLAAGGEARAAEDGGTRSVFATGAGVRPLALGGAYAALADDAAGWMWNPAGLALVRRAEFQISSGSFQALEARESFGGVVLPSWRWGAAQISYRQFSVNDIEGRDARNFETGEIGDRESELALGYARRMGEAWSFGVVTKARHQDLAGRTANAVGADMGVLASPAAWGIGGDWMRDLTIGFAVQNALAPSLRLDVDEVSDPSVMRLGVALKRPAFGAGSIIAALDYENGGGTGGFHAGLELSPYPSMQLRTGLSDGAFTVGTGVQFREFSFDYAFENAELEASHRLGLSFKFGSSVEESRRRGIAARERELEEQLAAAFEKRQAERLTALAQEATEALERGEHDVALDRIATLRALDPADTAARVLEARAYGARAGRLEKRKEFMAAMVDYRRALEAMPADTAAASGIERCEFETQRTSKRAVAIRSQFTAAVRAFAAGDLIAARSGFTEVLRLDPMDLEARDLLARTNAAIDARVEALADEAERHAAAGMIGDAEASLQKARVLAPRSPRVERAAAAIAGAREAAARKAAAPAPVAKSRPALSPAEQRQADDLYARGIAAFEKGRRDQGLRYLELVYDLDPTHPGVKAGLKREYLALGLEAFTNGQLPEAVSAWEKALKIDPTDERTAAYLLRARQHLARSRQIGSGQ